jgi:hypothetical protein
MSDAFETCSDAFETRSDALDYKIIDERSNDSLWIVLTDSFHGANPAFHESHNEPFNPNNHALFPINEPLYQNSEARGYSHEPLQLYQIPLESMSVP